MNSTTLTRAALAISAALLACPIAFAQSASSSPQPAGTAPRFDGKWQTKLSCPAKGNTQGYTWLIPSTVENGNFRGERGTAGEPGYLLLEGKISKDGSAKLTANGIVASRQYARGVFAHKGEEYSYNVKAQFQDAEGTGTRDAGLGIVGRPCTFDFSKQPSASQ